MNGGAVRGGLGGGRGVGKGWLGCAASLAWAVSAGGGCATGRVRGMTRLSPAAAAARLAWRRTIRGPPTCSPVHPGGGGVWRRRRRAVAAMAAAGGCGCGDGGGGGGFGGSGRVLGRPTALTLRGTVCVYEAVAVWSRRVWHGGWWAGGGLKGKLLVGGRMRQWGGGGGEDAPTGMAGMWGVAADSATASAVVDAAAASAAALSARRGTEGLGACRWRSLGGLQCAAVRAVLALRMLGDGERGGAVSSFPVAFSSCPCPPRWSPLPTDPHPPPKCNATGVSHPPPPPPCRASTPRPTHTCGGGGDARQCYGTASPPRPGTGRMA